MTEKPSIRSLAGHVLATDDDPEKLRLAAAVEPSLDPDAIAIPLGRKGIFAYVSKDDAHLANYKWHSKAFPKWGLVYAIRMIQLGGGKRKNRLLHREVMGVTGSKLPKIDHISGNGLDCRRVNLREACSETNGRNRVGAMCHSKSGVLGVYFHSGKQKWCADITYNKQRHYLGQFDTLGEATQARLEAEAREWGIHPRRAAAHGVSK